MKNLIAMMMAGIVFVACTGDAFARDHKGKGFSGGMEGGKGKRKKGGKRMRKPKMPYEVLEEKGLFPTDLKPKFPSGLNCPGVSSPFGSKTRYDGSRRNNPFYNFHNGMDVSLEIGTPLLAVADGTVIHKGTAGRLVGNYIWLHFPPEATDLPVHVFARYQHLDASSPLEVGEKVSAGQLIGPSGNTGTTGGHFGSDGYAHLHLNMLIGNNSKYRSKGPNIKMKGKKLLDPLGLFLPHPVDTIDNHLLRELPETKKTLSVSVKTADGLILPPRSKVVWPVACMVS